MAETPTHLMTMAFDPDLDDCVTIALRDMIADLPPHQSVARAGLYAVLARRRPPRHAGGQRQQRYPRDAGEEADRRLSAFAQPANSLLRPNAFVDSRRHAVSRARNRRHACARGHDVTCAARGVAGAAPQGARFIRVDRDDADGLAPLERRAFDAVIDVSRHPGPVRRAVEALKGRTPHWTFVSTVSVYADNRTLDSGRTPRPFGLPRGRRSSIAPRRPMAPPRSRASRRSARTRSSAGPG